jgi:hypothetical protein
MATGQRNLGMVDRSGIAQTVEFEMDDGFNGTTPIPRGHSSPHSLRADDTECLLKAANWLDEACEGDETYHQKQRKQGMVTGICVMYKDGKPYAV